MTDAPLKLALVEPDPIFRLGLRTWLSQFDDLEIRVEADSVATALATITHPMAQPTTPAPPSEAVPLSPENAPPMAQPLDLVIADFDLGGSRTEPGLGVQLCQYLHQQFPALPVLLLSADADPARPAIARAAGAQGYCLKGLAERELVAMIRQVAAGTAVWPESSAGESIPSFPPLGAPPALPPSLTWLEQVRLSWRQMGLQQIDAALADLNPQFNSPTLTQWERWWLRGRQRELRTARSLVNWLLPPVPLPPDTQLDPSVGSASPSRFSTGKLLRPTPPPASPDIPPAWLALDFSETSTTPADLRLVQTALFDAMFRKLQTNLQNLTDAPLEIDILRVEKRRELLLIILRKLEAILDELRFSQVQPEQLIEKCPIILRDLWTFATSDFFGRYYSLTIAGREIPVVPILLQEADQVEAAILSKIPGVSDALAHLLFRIPITVDNLTYAAGTPDAMSRMEALLENWVIAIANAVIYPLLNHFADVEVIKQGFYDRRLLSSREIERFRNELTWRYRMDLWVGEPTAIFESHYRLLTLSERGIKRITIYAPRRDELETLTGLQLAVTLVLETRDAVSPRLRSLVAFVGSGVVYLLTQVIGRGIGLIGRGILQGIGSSFQDVKMGRSGERQR